MPVECSISLRELDQEAFHTIDQAVMGLAFGIHNELGRFLDERVYQDELGYRCREAGLTALREVGLRAIHADFAKDYFLDLVVADGVIYELKACEQLTGVHEKQLINYLLLTGRQHGKLINFRPSSVESRFVSTRLTPAKRHDFEIDLSEWRETGPESEKMLTIIRELLEDWGAFLDLDLYREAVLHFLGGRDDLIHSVEIHSGERIIGRQNICLLNATTALHLSAMSRHLDTYGKHIHRLLRHTRLDAIQWINFNKSNISFRTVTKGKQFCHP